MGLLDSLVPPAMLPRDAWQAAAKGDVLLIDVREPHEFTAGHAPGSLNVPLGALPGALETLSWESRYVAVCERGARSRRATALMRKRGLRAVNLSGGMIGWKLAGLPVEEGAGAGAAA